MHVVIADCDVEIRTRNSVHKSVQDIFIGSLITGGKPPRPVATPSDQVVKVGETARFHCDPNSDTAANVRWGYETSDGPLRGDVVQDGNDLIVRSADNSVAGEYICIATNQYGSGEAEPVRLHVTESMSFKIESKSVQLMFEAFHFQQ